MPPSTPPIVFTENMQMLAWALMLVISLAIAFYVMGRRLPNDAGAKRHTSGSARRSGANRMRAAREDEDDEMDQEEMTTSRMY